MSDGEPEDAEEPQEPEDERAVLEAKLAELEKELQYSKAETANARQRGQRDKAQAIRFGAAGLASRIIPAIDSLEKAIANENGDNEAITNGVKMTLDSLKRALESEGVTILETTGKLFDPTQMEAIATVPVQEGQESGEVLEEIESGYLLHDRVLRPAKVIVTSE
ncbi:MAG: nucleotide exchange factor GrpE [Euryarchaeota archaeon]|jgi:molecular chaperone GrpE|nr:nucleotide exchange factor GrpE [Euryarchaeota archaeon]